MTESRLVRVDAQALPAPAAAPLPLPPGPAPAPAADGPATAEDLLEALQRYVREPARCGAADLERRLLQMQKLMTLGQVTSEVAHDFGNLMTVVLGYSELLLAATSKTETNYPHLDALHVAAERASALIAQLVGFTREPGDEPKALDLSAIVRHLEPMVARLLGRSVELRVKCASRRRFDLGRLAADRTSGGESRAQCPRRAHRPRPGRHRRRPGALGRSIGPRIRHRAVWRLRHSAGRRHRPRHGRRNAPPSLPAVLHHERTRRRFGPGDRRPRRSRIEHRHRRGKHAGAGSAFTLYFPAKAAA